MNKLFYSGSFRTVSYKEGSGYIFKIGARRDYKNKTTGKTEYDNITFITPAFNEGTINFIKSYVKDGDFVEIEGHFHSYTTEKDGEKVYHEDKICDALRLVGNRNNSQGESLKEEDATNIPDGFELIDGDCPW